MEFQIPPILTKCLENGIPGNSKGQLRPFKWLEFWDMVEETSHFKLTCLSSARRLTLAKYVLFSIPFHISLVIPIPRKSCLFIERLMRNFLWSAFPDSTKINLVNWETICLLRKREGLACRGSRNSTKLACLTWARR